MLTKLLATVSYSSRKKYWTNSDKIYSIVVQETQAEAVIIEEAEEHLSNQFNTRPVLLGELLTISNYQEWATSPKTNLGWKQYIFRYLWNKTKVKDGLLSCFFFFFFQENAMKFEQKIQDIFNKEMLNACNKSKSVSECF